MNHKKIVKIITFLVVLYITVIFIIPRVIIFPYLWKMPKSEYPTLYLSPTEVALNQNKTLEYPVKEFKELKFIIPYKGNLSEKLSKEGISKTFNFDGSKKMVVLEGLNPISSFYANGGYERLFFLTTQKIDSNIALYRALASARVDQINIFDNNKVLTTKFVNVTLKSTIFFGKDSKSLYHFITPNIEAFQPEMISVKNIPVNVVDKKTDKDYLFLFSKNISQKEINLVLSSVKSK